MGIIRPQPDDGERRLSATPSRMLFPGRYILKIVLGEGFKWMIISAADRDLSYKLRLSPGASRQIGDPE